MDRWGGDEMGVIVVPHTVSHRCVTGMARLDLDRRVADPELAADRLLDRSDKVL
jgi:hypothetical protein